MGTRDSRIDAYIDRAADFAKPILRHLREVVHAAVPEVQEDMKWSSPHFLYKGMLCSMAAFKKHVAFGFWKGGLVLGDKADRTAMGHLGRVTSVGDLPSDKTLKGWIRKAAALNEAGVKIARTPPAPRKPLAVPPYFATALRRNKTARDTFDALGYSHRKEYLEWVTDAKTEATRQKRVDTAIAWLSEGKSLNWRYRNRATG